MMKIEVEITDPRISLPSKAHEDDTGFDVHAAVQDDLVLEPGVPHLVDTGVRLRPRTDTIPNARIDISIRPRSGWSSKGILVSLGTIDAGYRGNVKVCMINLTKENISVPVMSKIAQLVFTQPIRVHLEKVDSVELDSTRQESGFGSSGF